MGYTDSRILDELDHGARDRAGSTRLGLGAHPKSKVASVAQHVSRPAGKFLLVDASGKLDMSKYQERVGDIPTSNAEWRRTSPERNWKR
jgi:hypothetical protein